MHIPFAAHGAHMRKVRADAIMDPNAAVIGYRKNAFANLLLQNTMLVINNKEILLQAPTNDK